MEKRQIEEASAQSVELEESQTGTDGKNRSTTTAAETEEGGSKNRNRRENVTESSKASTGSGGQTLNEFSHFLDFQDESNRSLDGHASWANILMLIHKLLAKFNSLNLLLTY